MSGCQGSGQATTETTASSAASSAGTSADLTWTERPLPDGTQAVAVAPAGDGVVVGAHAPSRPNPRMFLVHDDTLTAVDVEPETPYAHVARWLSIAAHDGQLVAVGGARGGAHANYRWTVWAGSLDGTRPRLVEQPQPFGVFGGWGAGDLTGIAFAGAEPVVAGAWASERTGNDVSLWRRTGDRWKRQDSTGTPLGSTPAALHGARFITSTGDGIALAGSVTDLGTGSVTSVPALWTAPTAEGPFTVVRLPASESIAEAHAARCEGDSCLVVGADGGTLAVWEVEGASVTRAATPHVAVAEKQAVPPPVRVRGTDLVVLPGTVLHRGSAGWQQRQAPPGVPVSAAVAGDTVYVVTMDGEGTGRVWSAQP